MNRGMGTLLLVALAACGNSGVAPPKATTEDSLAPDQVMIGMKTVIVRNGVRTSLAEADTAFINQTSQMADLIGVRITFYDTTTGRTISVVTSKTGQYDFGKESLDARGNVVAVTSEEKILKTEHLVYDNVANRIHSDTAFTMTGATENIAGSAFESDPGFKSVLVVHPVGQEKQAPVRRAGTKAPGGGGQ
jgi:LPS export ABC transporter protein LptC